MQFWNCLFHQSKTVQQASIEFYKRKGSAMLVHVLRQHMFVAELC